MRIFFCIGIKKIIMGRMIIKLIKEWIKVIVSIRIIVSIIYLYWKVLVLRFIIFIVFKFCILKLYVSNCIFCFKGCFVIGWIL